METQLRVVSVEDWAAFKAIRLQALADSPTAFGATLADAAAQSDAAWRARVDGPGPTIVAFDRENPVGMGGLFVPDGTCEAFVWGMWVAPSARGQGLGRAILRELLDRARDQDRTVLLHVTEGNESARRLYEANGFVPTGEWQPLREGSSQRIEALRHEGA